jgi:hypothetical protein
VTGKASDLAVNDRTYAGVMAPADLPAVFTELQRRLAVHEDAFRPTGNLTDANRPTSRRVDEPSPGDTYMLLGAPHERYPDGMLFAGVKQQKRYVSFYLMPVYTEPVLADAVSPDLRRRMQGKSCFNFTRVDEGLFDELADLTSRGREAYAAKGWTL